MDEKYLLDAHEVSALLGVKIGMAYAIIRKLNAELEKMGKITLRGKVNKKYLLSKLEV